jgi:ABC-2 type transport system permease protein
MRAMATDIAQDMKRTWLAMTFELDCHLHRRRVPLIVALAVLTSLLFYVIPMVLGKDLPESAGEFAANNLGFIGWLVVIAGAMFAGDAISGEFERKTGLLLFPTPQRRTSIFIGKYLATLAATFLVVAIYFLVTVLEMADLYGVGAGTDGLALSFLVALLYSTGVVSVIFFLSSVFKRSVTSSLTGFFLFLLVLPITSGVLRGVDLEPWFLITYSSKLIQDVLLVQNAVAYGPGRHSNAGVFEPDFMLGVMVMTAYTVLFFIASIMIACRKGME